MPCAVIGGVPIEYDKRLQAHLRDRDQVAFRESWQVEVIRAKSRTRVTGRPDAIVSQLQEPGWKEAHVLCFRPGSKSARRKLRDQLVPYFRFRWLDNGLLELFPHSVDCFIEKMNSDLRKEESWIEEIKPSSVGSALLLPISSFDCEDHLEKMWQLASHAADEDTMREILRKLTEFKESHHRPVEGGPRCWVDIRERIFDHRGPWHGTAPFPRSSKYSFSIPDGFHYDVTAAHGRRFRLVDYMGEYYAAGAGDHINVDPHGWVV